MKLSELKAEDAMAHAVVSEADPDAALFPHYLDAAKSYVLGYTGLTAEQADDKPELAIAALVVFAELVRNKEATVSDGNVNLVLESFLGMHSVNLL